MDGHEALVHDVTIITEPSTKNSPAFSSKVCSEVCRSADLRSLREPCLVPEPCPEERSCSKYLNTGVGNRQPLPDGSTKCIIVAIC